MMALMFYFPSLIFSLGWIQERHGAYRQFQPQKNQLPAALQVLFPPLPRTDKDLNSNIWEKTNSLYLPYAHHVLSDRWVSGGHMDDYRWLNPQQHMTPLQRKNSPRPSSIDATWKNSCTYSTEEAWRHLDWLAALELLTSPEHQD